jgi:hypothetical protein
LALQATCHVRSSYHGAESMGIVGKS